MPIRLTEISIKAKLGAIDKAIRPVRVKPMPMASE